MSSTVARLKTRATHCALTTCAGTSRQSADYKAKSRGRQDTGRYYSISNNKREATGVDALGSKLLQRTTANDLRWQTGDRLANAPTDGGDRPRSGLRSAFAQPCSPRVRACVAALCWCVPFLFFILIKDCPPTARKLTSTKTGKALHFPFIFQAK